MKKVPKSEFKPKAFECLRMVEERAEPLVVTDHGRDAVRIEPIVAGSGGAKDALLGSVLHYEAQEEPAGEEEEWEVMR